MTPLIVAVKVHAIVQSENRAVVGPEMDFESLPYYDQALQMDMNPSLPYLAESIISQPFDDCNFLLKKGVHINWDFPDFLKRSKIGAPSSTEFPPVPTRWYIIRYIGEDVDKEWIIESDAVLQDLRGVNFMDMAQTSLNVDIHSGKRPYSYMGRREELNEWVERGGDPGPQYTNWKDVQGTPLTALGWGSPSFDIFYPNCRSVFGFHDSEITNAAGNLKYKVIGWYGDESDDYWNYYLSNKEAEIASVLNHLNELTHLDIETKKKHAKEVIEKMITDSLAISLDITSYISIEEEKIKVGIPTGGMICIGEVLVTTEPGDPFSEMGNPHFALGNTPTEALSAMIVAEQFKGLKDLEREKLEDTFEAILMGDRLKSLNADIGPKFREFRHADQFYGSDGGVVWAIQLVDDNPNKALHGDPHAEKTSVPTLPGSIAPFIASLNNAQRNYDKALFELESLRMELYADWYRYMHCAYPPPGETEEFVDVNEIKAAIEKGSLQRFTLAKEYLGSVLNYESRTFAEPGAGASLAEEVKKRWRELKRHLGIENQIIADQVKPPNAYHWEIHHDPAPRFWEPAAPVVVVAIPRSKKVAQKGDNKIISGHFFDKKIILDAAGFDVTALLETQHPASGLSQSEGHNLFKAEWEVEVFPVASMHQTTRSGGKFNPKFVLNNYSLGENEPDYDDDPALTGTLAMVKTASVYTGATYINPNVGGRYLALLQNYIDQQANVDQIPFQREVKLATDFLDKFDLMTLTLSGFNTALLQMHQSVQLNPADPLGFDDYQEFAEKMAEALPSSRGFSPDPHAVFLPIRSGGLRLLNLRMVDLFGRFVEFTPDVISTPFSFTMPDHPDWAWLPPRLSQAARVNFRFLQSDTLTDGASNSLQETSPVCGWIVPNLLDQSLVFFEASGKNIGEINQNGVWNGPEPIGFLGAVKRWLTEPNLLSAFLEDIEEAMDNIHPNDRDGQSAFSVLMGRPMAVVCASVQLEVKGLQAVNMGWGEFRKDSVREGRETNGFEYVQFPFRIGEYRQQNDGLIGYWTVGDDGQISDIFNVNDAVSASINIENIGKGMDHWLGEKDEAWKLQDAKQCSLSDYLKDNEDSPIKKQDLIQPYFREGSLLWDVLVQKGWITPESKEDKIAHYAEAGKLSISLADAMQQFICLMDPFGQVHLSSGIQPVKSIQLPALFVKQALRNMEVSFLTAPVLGPEAGIELTLPNEQEYTWSWEEPNSWPKQSSGVLTDGKTSLAEKDIAAFRVSANFPDRTVLREGKLALRQRNVNTPDESATLTESN
jgi:hypothetical protein